jgi:hypothetical protein
MSTQELKNALHESIENITDETFLNTVYELVHRRYEVEKEPSLSKKQLERLKSAEENINNGSFFTQNQADSLVKEWLKKA